MTFSRLRAGRNRVVLIDEVSSPIRSLVRAIRAAICEVVWYLWFLGEKIVRQGSWRDFRVGAFSSTLLAFQHPPLGTHERSLGLTEKLEIQNKLDELVQKTGGYSQPLTSLTTFRGSLALPTPTNLECRK
jgi:hypothetical protein